MTDLWYPGARKWQGNPAVTGYPDAYAKSVGYAGTGAFGPKRGAVLHSAEGTNWDVIHDLLLTKSWHFTIGYDRVEQHHPWNVNCWHCTDTDPDGGIRGNFELDGIEALGVAGTPLNEYQQAEEVKLSRWLAAQNGRSIFRRFDGWEPNEAGVWVLCEHKEIGNTPTSCPSGRIPWTPIMAALNATAKELEDSDMPAPWVRDTKTFKSYYIVGGRKRYVKDAAEENALLKARYIVHPAIGMTTAELAAIEDAA